MAPPCGLGVVVACTHMSGFMTHLQHMSKRCLQQESGPLQRKKSHVQSAGKEHCYHYTHYDLGESKGDNFKILVNKHYHHSTHYDLSGTARGTISKFWLMLECQFVCEFELVYYQNFHGVPYRKYCVYHSIVLLTCEYSGSGH